MHAATFNTSAYSATVMQIALRHQHVRTMNHHPLCVGTSQGLFPDTVGKKRQLCWRQMNACMCTSTGEGLGCV